MKCTAVKTVTVFIILSMLLMPVFADIPYEIRHENQILDQQEKKEDSRVKTKTIKKNDSDEENNENETKAELDIFEKENETVIKGKFKQTNASFLLIVKLLEDDSIKYLNTGKTDDSGEYTFTIELNDDVYLIEVICNNERVVKDYKVLSN